MYNLLCAGSCAGSSATRSEPVKTLMCIRLGYQTWDAEMRQSKVFEETAAGNASHHAGLSKPGPAKALLTCSGHTVATGMPVVWHSH